MRLAAGVENAGLAFHHSCEALWVRRSHLDSVGSYAALGIGWRTNLADGDGFGTAAMRSWHAAVESESAGRVELVESEDSHFAGWLGSLRLLAEALGRNSRAAAEQ